MPTKRDAPLRGRRVSNTITEGVKHQYTSLAGSTLTSLRQQKEDVPLRGRRASNTLAGGVTSQYIQCLEIVQTQMIVRIQLV